MNSSLQAFTIYSFLHLLFAMLDGEVGLHSSLQILVSHRVFHIASNQSCSRGGTLLVNNRCTPQANVIKILTYKSALPALAPFCWCGEMQMGEVMSQHITVRIMLIMPLQGVLHSLQVRCTPICPTQADLLLGRDHHIFFWGVYLTHTLCLCVTVAHRCMVDTRDFRGLRRTFT